MAGEAGGMSGDNTIILSPDRQSLKVAFKELTVAFGGQEAAAAETGKSQSRICSYGLPNSADFAPIDVVATLEDRTHGTPGHPHVTRANARRLGFGLVKLPDPSARPVQWSRFVGELGTEAGDLIGGICSDLSTDNDVSPREAKRRLKDAAELVRVAVEIEAALQARAGEAE